MGSRFEKSEGRYKETDNRPTEEFLGQISKLAKEVVLSADYHDHETGYISTAAWKRLVGGGILSSILLERDPDKRQEEIMRISRALSYHDLHLGLTFGIVAALGVMPMQRFASSEEQLEEYLDIVRNGNLVALGITELFKSGTAALDMDSCYEIDESGERARVSILKQFQGLSGGAGMTVALLKKDAKRKTAGLFYIPQEYIKTQVTEMAGLKGIRYGINTGDLVLDLKKHLLVELPRERLEEFQDIFTKSRILFISMTLGHLERMEDEAVDFASRRVIGDRLQGEIPAVQGVLQQIRAHRVIAEAIFEETIRYRSPNGQTLIESDTLSEVMVANIIKVLGTDYAIAAADWRAELRGGAAFYKGNALQDLIDIWPFKIFEGSRLYMNNQICGDFFAPVRVEGKVVLPGFLSESNKDNNFGEYFFQTIKHRKLFNGPQILRSLDEWTGLMLTQITPANAHAEIRGVIGEIIQRLFALGCLTGDNQEEAKAVLNLEIAQLAQHFAPWS